MKRFIAAALCFAMALLLAVDHRRLHGRFFHRHDLDSHEILEVMLVAYAIGLLC